MTPRLLDLFSGAGGAAMGYALAGFDVVGVDLKPQPRYPFHHIVADAMAVLADSEFLGQFDVVHASCPCQSYSSLGRMNAAMGRVIKSPRLIEPTREALTSWGGVYVIENVPGAPLRADLKLCGSMFGLNVRRHRLFECNVPLAQPRCEHQDHDFVGVYGDHPESATVGADDGYNRKPRAATVDEAQDAMGIDWMGWNELREAIPWAYTKLIGDQLIAALRRDETPRFRNATCGCGRLIPQPRVGRPRRHCSPRCRQATYRERTSAMGTRRDTPER